MNYNIRIIVFPHLNNSPPRKKIKSFELSLRISPYLSLSLSELVK